MWIIWYVWQCTYCCCHCYQADRQGPWASFYIGMCYIWKQRVCMDVCLWSVRSHIPAQSNGRISVVTHEPPYSGHTKRPARKLNWTQRKLLAVERWLLSVCLLVFFIIFLFFFLFFIFLLVWLFAFCSSQYWIFRGKTDICFWVCLMSNASKVNIWITVNFP